MCSFDTCSEEEDGAFFFCARECVCVSTGSRTDISWKDRIRRSVHIFFRTLFPDRKRWWVLLRFSAFTPVSAAHRIVLGGDLVVDCGQTMKRR